MAIIKHEEKEPLWNLAVRGKTVSKQTLETERDRECVMCVCVCVCVRLRIILNCVRIKFHSFTVHFNSLNFTHQQCTSIYNKILV